MAASFQKTNLPRRDLPRRRTDWRLPALAPAAKRRIADPGGSASMQARRVVRPGGRDPGKSQQKTKTCRCAVEIWDRFAGLHGSSPPHGRRFPVVPCHRGIDVVPAAPAASLARFGLDPATPLDRRSTRLACRAMRLMKRPPGQPNPPPGFACRMVRLAIPPVGLACRAMRLAIPADGFTCREVRLGCRIAGQACRLVRLACRVLRPANPKARLAIPPDGFDCRKTRQAIRPPGAANTPTRPAAGRSR